MIEMMMIIAIVDCDVNNGGRNNNRSTLIGCFDDDDDDDSLNHRNYASTLTMITINQVSQSLINLT